MTYQSDNESMDLVDSSEDEGFLSDSSIQSWIFPMAKPPPDADYDIAFVQSIQEAIDIKYPKTSMCESSHHFDRVEYGRRDTMTIEEIPFGLQGSQQQQQFTVPEFQYDEDWLCLENEQEKHSFKYQLDKCNKEVKQESFFIESLQDIKSHIMEETPQDTNDSNGFLHQIVMTSTPKPKTPLLKKEIKRALTTSPSRLPIFTGNIHKRELNDDVFDLDNELVEKRRADMFNHKPENKHNKRHLLFNLRK